MQLPELILIDKPAGITSFDVIRELRKRTGVRKFGHGGTLDPMATGLMLIGVEAGTKKLAEYIKLDKEYVAAIRLGERYSTGDVTGELLEVGEASAAVVSHSDTTAALHALTGTHTLPVSAYSAIKKDGVPMYKRAYAAAKLGELVDDVPFRVMRVYEVELLGIEGRTLSGGLAGQVAHARFSVASGTYIRSLAEELGRRLGIPATLEALRRTKVGDFRIEDAQQLTDF